LDTTLNVGRAVAGKEYLPNASKRLADAEKRYKELVKKEVARLHLDPKKDKEKIKAIKKKMHDIAYKGLLKNKKY